MYRQQGFPWGQEGFEGAYGPGQGQWPGGPGPGQGGMPVRPPFGFPGEGGFPGGGPNQPPQGLPFGGGPQGQLPPPPSSTPQADGLGLQAVDPGSFYGCMYRYTWVRLENGRSFWFYPIYIGRNSVAGYRWQRRRQRWVYTGMDTRQIVSFQCY